MVHKDIRKKLKDPGSFNIPCFIGDLSYDRALANLVASINLMPFYLIEKMNLPTLTPTRM